MPIAHAPSHPDLLLRIRRQIEAMYSTAPADGAGEVVAFLLDMLGDDGRPVAERADVPAAVAASPARAPDGAAERAVTRGVPCPLMTDLFQPDSAGCPGPSPRARPGAAVTMTAARFGTRPIANPNPQLRSR